MSCNILACTDGFHMLGRHFEAGDKNTSSLVRSRGDAGLSCPVCRGYLHSVLCRRVAIVR